MLEVILSVESVVSAAMTFTPESEARSTKCQALHTIDTNDSKHQSWGAVPPHFDGPVLENGEMPSDFVICRCSCRLCQRIIYCHRASILMNGMLLKQWFATDQKPGIGLGNENQSRLLWLNQYALRSDFRQQQPGEQPQPRHTATYEPIRGYPPVAT